MAGFVKLDRGLIASTGWADVNTRCIWITALLLAELYEVREPTPQLELTSLDETGWMVPPGWYGKVPAASTGIIRLAGIDQEKGMAALERMGKPEPESRSQEFDGRRLVRINGGFLALNYANHIARDHTSAERQARWRARNAAPRPDVAEEMRIARMAVRERDDIESS